MIFRVIFAVFFLTLSPLAAESLPWMTNFQKALEKGKQEGKAILLFFTGSDWSGWSMKMKKEILDAPEFVEKIEQRFICVQIDFPHYRSLTSEEENQNLLLKERYEINEYPRLIILDTSEREIARLGYSPEKGKKFAEDLICIVERDRYLTKVMGQLAAQGFSSIDLKTFYIEARELHRTEDAGLLLDVGLKSADPHFFLLEKYRLLVEEGKGQQEEATALLDQLKKLDPKNQRGTQFSLALIHFQELASQDNKRRDPKEVIRPLEEYLELYGELDNENVWRVEMMIAQFYLEADECKIALKHAEIAHKSAPADKKLEIEQSLDYIRKQASFVVESK